MTEDLTKDEGSKRLKESDWIVIVSLWESGEVTLGDLSDRFHISKPALSQGLKRRKAVRGSKAHVATKKVQEKIEAEREKMIEDIYNFKKRYLGYGNYLADTAITIVKEAATPGGRGIANVRGELATLVEASKIVNKTRDDIFHLYGLYDKEDAKEQNMDFNIGVYSQKDIDALREAQKVFATSGEDEEDYDDEDLPEDDEIKPGEDYDGVA